jgi:hypothetical protein
LELLEINKDKISKILFNTQVTSNLKEKQNQLKGILSNSTIEEEEFEEISNYIDKRYLFNIDAFNDDVKFKKGGDEIFEDGDQIPFDSSIFL